jgi:UDP-N-acetylglucosamine 4,6-dehydratase/5-epimerase
MSSMTSSILRTFDELRPDLDGKDILVTGGTGSFGKAFIKTVLAQWQPRRLIVFSRDELKQFEMAEEWPSDRFDCMRYFIGDVRDVDRLEMALRGVDFVVHAAALKHVPAAEYNPFECIATNVHGAENLVKACLRTKVKRLVALSTDKAVNPVNLYGASKLASDKIFIAANNLSGRGGTRFSVVRYGNVFGSRGSVVPLFRRLIERGEKELPITDQRMTRFWITVDQGVHFVLSSLHMMSGGEIFVPKIASMRLTDLARAMAPHMQHRIIGIRPGEKLHEVLLTEDDNRWTYELPDRYAILSSTTDPAKLVVPSGASGVAEGFRYGSNTNSEWLDKASLLAMVRGVQAAAGEQPDDDLPEVVFIKKQYVKGGAKR